MADESKLRMEIAKALADDDTRLGDVIRGNAAGQSADEIAEELGVATSGFVWNYLRHARAIEEGDLPSAPTMIRQSLSTMRGFLDRHTETLSEAAQSLLRSRIRELEALSSNSETEVLEDEQVRERAKQTEDLDITGIYVYTLPHYYRQPVEPVDSDVFSARTLMKIGMSENDVIKRFRSQQRDTVLPEDPWLLRIYECDTDIKKMELEFHNMLKAADHRQARGRTTGKEWFLTTLKFLDEIAKMRGLETKYRIEDAINEESE
jgi:hypothetical protein